jgi:hypothetical protein
MSKEMKHTPGPWYVDPIRISPSATIHIRSNAYAEIPGEFMPIADVRAGVHVGEDEANARLIAAAPELLAALKSLTAHLGPDGYIPQAGEHATKQALAAIARATGDAT